MEDTPEKSPSRIPTPSGRFRRTASCRVRGERPVILYSTSPTPFPSISEREEVRSLAGSSWTPSRFNLCQRSRSQASGLNRREDDLDSVDSFGSNISSMSKMSSRSNCEHSPFAKNGTTFSARSNKFILHCSSGHNTAPEEYLTPTQRANRSIRRLKTLLQLAKEKLMEKEKEIFKLTKEVVELKVFKASIRNSHFSEASTPSDIKEDLPEEKSVEGATYTVEDVPCDTYADLTPIKTTYCFEEKLEDTEKPSPRGKLSPTSPLHLREKMSATPDYLLSSLADSGNFDDLASSLSLQSKDSLNLQALLEEEKIDGIEHGEKDDEHSKLVQMYETMLMEHKDSYEKELHIVKMANEENNLRMIDNFEMKLKEEEEKFEDRFKELMQTSENEKIEIVERFEKKLAEEKKQYFVNLKNNQVENGDINNCENYLLRIEEEKAVYEQSLLEIKKKFEKEQKLIEKSFDDAMAAERRKFEDSVTAIQEESDRQTKLLSEKLSNFESKYNELLEKYNNSLIKISQLEEENKLLKSSLDQQQAKEREMYLKMYVKGQEAVKFQHEGEAVNGPTSQSTIIPVPELLVQLKVTKAELENLKDTEYRSQNSDGRGACLLSAKEALSLWMLAARKAMYKRLAEAQQRPAEASQRPPSSSSQDPEATLQFLKSAVYYFLTDRDNHLEHLRAIESILGFSPSEKRDIETNYMY